jgi:hypothetical protein
MWLFNAVPEDRLAKEFHFRPSQQWLDHLRLSCTRLGASGAFVSPDGLILTNHHVAAGGLQNASTKDKDYVAEGFLAKTRDQELKLPGLEMTVLEQIEDVTDQVNKLLDPKLTGEAAVKNRNAAFAQIEHASEQATGLQSNIVTLYGGAKYDLYRYKRYTDIRAVFAPEFSIAFFGGDTDNYEYPRYDLDITLLRAYENGQPVHPKDYLKISRAGLKENDLVFAAGNPGTTDRLLPVSALVAMRETLPLSVESSERTVRALQSYSSRGAEQARQAQREIFGLQNSLKAMKPRLAAITDTFLAKKSAEETAMRSHLKANPQLTQYDTAWTDIAVAEDRSKSLLFPYRFLEGMLSSTTYFGHARTLLRHAEEAQKSDAQRLPEYTEARFPPLQNRLLSAVPIYPDMETVKLTEFLTFYQEKLGVNSPLIQKVLAGKTPEARARELIAGTKLGDAGERKRLFDGGIQAIDASTDPMILLAKQIDPDARAIRQRYESEVSEPITRALTQINRARFALYGTSLYPDATGTLRLSFGIVKSYPQDGQQIPAFTTMGGALDYAARHAGKPDYTLPASWTVARSAINPQTPLNFVSTADITNGNSGSPVVNTSGELVGIIFDSNRQGVPNNLAFSDYQARAVSVDSRAILEALHSIYHADLLLEELLGKSDGSR